MAVPWLRRLVVGLSQWRTGFDQRDARVRLAWTESHCDRFIAEYFGFLLSLSFYHRSTFIFYSRTKTSVILVRPIGSVLK
jgi:hypothetical protein